MAERRKSKSLKVVDLIKKFAGEKGKKAAEKKFGVEAVKAAQATVSKRKIVSKPNKKRPKQSAKSYPSDVTPELTGKDLDFGYEPIAPKIKKQGSGFGQKGGQPMLGKYQKSGVFVKRQKKRGKGFQPGPMTTIKDLKKGPSAKGQDRLLKGGQRGREKISRKAGGKVMTGSQLIASLYD